MQRSRVIPVTLARVAQIWSTSGCISANSAPICPPLSGARLFHISRQVLRSGQLIKILVLISLNTTDTGCVISPSHVSHKSNKHRQHFGQSRPSSSQIRSAPARSKSARNSRMRGKVGLYGPKQCFLCKAFHKALWSYVSDRLEQLVEQAGACESVALPVTAT